MEAAQSDAATSFVAQLVDPQASDAQLEELFKQADSHPQAANIRQRLIDENKEVWWTMAFNISGSDTPSATPHAFIGPQEITHTAQIYKSNYHLRTLDISQNGAIVGSLIENSRFCLDDPKKLDLLKLTREKGGKIIAIKENDAKTALLIHKLNEIATCPHQSDQVSINSYSNQVKKIIMSANGICAYITLFDGESRFCLLSDGAITCQLANTLSEKITNITIDDNCEYGIFTTSSKLVKVFKIDSNNLMSVGCNFDGIPNCVDVTGSGTHGIICTEAKIQRMDPKKLFNTKISEITTFSTKNLTNARLSQCGQYVFSVHSDGLLVIHNIKNVSFIQQCIPNQVLTKIAINRPEDSLVFGGGPCIGRATISPLLKHLQKTQISDIAALIQVWRKQEQVTACPNLKERFLKMKMSNRKPLLKSAKINLDDTGLSDCPICYDEIADSITPCKHAFCGNCLEQSIKNSQKCPLCRQPLSQP